LKITSGDEWFELRAQILMHDKFYDEVIGEIEKQQSSAFLRTKIIGQSIFSRELLCEVRSLYVVDRANRELRAQFDSIVGNLRARFLCTPDLHHLYQYDSPPFESFKEELYKSFRDELEYLPMRDVGIENINSHKTSRDFVWEDGGKRPSADYYRGIEGWFSAARAACNALDPQDNEENKYKFFVRAIQDEVHGKLASVGDQRFLAIALEINDVNAAGLWKDCLILVQNLAADQLWQVGQKWPAAASHPY